MAVLTGYKTYLAALAALLVALGATIQAYVDGTAINYQIVIEAFIALAMIFLRKGIADTTKTA